MMLRLALVLGLAWVGLATKGVDVSQRYSSTSTWSCLKKAGYSFAIVRGYQSICRPDPNVRATVAAAKNGGFKYVDVYVFPDPRCSRSAAQQMNDAIANLNGLDYGMLWIDVEAKSPYWPNSCSWNQNFVQEMVNKAKSLGKRVGIYSSYYNWQSIMCGWTGVSSLPLWYAHYDHNPSFSDFRSFGGWSRPSIKQYSDAGNQCGAGYDINYY